MQLTALLILALGSFLAAAATIPKLAGREVSANQYEISTLKTHFMGKNSGIADGSWPAGSEFNSTIELVVNYPGADANDPVSTTCTGSWVNGSHPVDWNACDDIDVAWKFTDFTTEAKFTIEVGRIVSEASANTGSVSVKANNPSDEDSWFTCLGGAPLQGMKCDLDGTLSNKKSPIPVPVVAGPAFAIP